MMQGTPRTFVGPTVFLLRGRICRHVADAVRTRVAAIPGIGTCELDVHARVLVVTARDPVDRADVLAVLHAAGCPVHA